MTLRKVLPALGLALVLLFPANSSLARDGDVIVGLAKAPPSALQESLDQMFFDYSVFELSTAQIEHRVRKEGALTLHLGGRTLDLVLEVNDLRAPGYREILRVDGQAVEQTPTPQFTYRGSVVGEPESIVRLAILPNYFSGYVKTDAEWLFIDPLNDFDKGLAATDEVVVYRDQDIRELAAGVCGAHRMKSHARQLESNALAAPRKVGESSNLASNTLQVATECDGQYFTSYGNPGSFNRMSAVLNAVDGIYESEIDTSISIVAQQCWPNISTDPYTSLNASTTLTQFRNWWNANMTGTSRDVAHQFSGKNFSGSTIGIAYVGVICNAASFSYGISQDLSSSRQRRRLTAHEIGHNLSANHDNQAPVCSGVSCNGSGPLMCASIQGGSSSAADDFSNCSLDDIDDHISAFGSCL